MATSEDRPIIIANTLFFKKILEEKGFSISHRFENVASSADVYVYFENPSTSNKKVNIAIIEVVSLAQVWIDIYRNVTVSSHGTSITPMNLNLGSTENSVVTVEYGGSYSFGDPTLNTVCPGGSKQNAVGGTTEVGETLIVPSGYNILVKITNKSTASTDLSVRILWWEE
jgi:hypothetical protein